MTERAALLASLAHTIADYRVGEIARPTPDHVNTWLNQFAPGVQVPLLRELAYVLKRTYIKRATVQSFVTNLLVAEQLVGQNPMTFWKRANFLRIQSSGNSQRDILTMLDDRLQEMYGFSIDDCGSTDGPYLYFDDVMYTGNRILNDLKDWITWSAPTTARIRVILLGYHRRGQEYASTRLAHASAAARKHITMTWSRAWEIEDRDDHLSTSDVLRPSTIPIDDATQRYIKTLVLYGDAYPPVPRPGTSIGEHEFFSSNAGRCVLEQEFLKAGLYIRSVNPYLNTYQRPLGNVVLRSLGFGAMIVTYRNCANNCPLALWAGDPWYPLFPRRTNTYTELKRQLSLVSSTSGD